MKTKTKFLNVMNWEIDVKNRSIIVYSNFKDVICAKRYFIDEYQINESNFRIESSSCTDLLDLETDEFEWKDCSYVINCNIAGHAYMTKGKIIMRTHFIPIEHMPNGDILGTYRNVLSRLKSTGATLTK